jgi:hypothetical protein
MWQEHDLVFCREDGTPLDRWHVRKEFGKITKAARLGGAWTPRELRHSRSCPSSARTMPTCRTLPTWSGTAARRSPRRSTVTRSSPPSPKTAPAVNRTLKANATEPTCPRSGKAIGSRNWDLKTPLTSRDGGI